MESREQLRDSRGFRLRQSATAIRLAADVLNWLKTKTGQTLTKRSPGLVSARFRGAVQEKYSADPPARRPHLKAHNGERRTTALPPPADLPLADHHGAVDPAPGHRRRPWTRHPAA